MNTRVVWLSGSYLDTQWRRPDFRRMSFADAKAWLLWDIFIKGKEAS